MKYKEWLKEWLDNYIEPVAKKKTYVRYNEIVYQHICPYLGTYELNDLTPIILQKFITHLLQNGNLKTGEGLSTNSVNSIITVIQGTLKMANRIGLLDEYIGDKIRRPKTIEKKVSCFTLNEQKMIEQAVKNDKRSRMFGIILCLYTGLRIGEILALEWSDIDFIKSELTVSKTCYDGRDEKGNYGRITDSPKTESSRRIIPIPRQLLPHLREVKRKSQSKYVVSNGEKNVSVRAYQKSFAVLLKHLEIKHKGFHSLRHTFATRALESGMDVKSLSEILGHKTMTTALNRYVHSLLKHKKEMMNKLGKLL